MYVPKWIVVVFAIGIVATSIVSVFNRVRRDKDENDLRTQNATLLEERTILQEEVAKKAIETAGYRLSCHELCSKDIVCYVYTASTREFCWWEEARQGRSLKSDRIQNGEGCVGYFVCSDNPQRVHTPPGPEVDVSPDTFPTWLDSQDD